MADIIGTPNDDNLIGTTDPDFISGEGGDDTISADAGDDFALGGDGNDQIDMGAGFDQAIGNAGDDILRGGADNDHLYGEVSGETESGVTGDDQLFGGDGNDFMRGGLGNDYMDGGSGSDRTSYFSSPGSVHIDLRIQGVAQDTGSAGMDTLVNVENTTGSIFADVLIGNNQANWIWSHGGGDNITGNAGDDTIWLPSGDGAVVHGNQGVDVVSFTGRSDPTVIAGITIDLGIQGSAQDTGLGLVTLRSIEGAEGSDFNDVMEGNSADNILSGRTGDDTIDGLGGDDLIQGDITIRLVGEQVFDLNDPTITGNDTLNGGGGEDAIYGNRGDDVINGGTGADTISGDEGADRLIGGGGDDTFVYASAAESTSTTFDTLVSFNFHSTDIFDLPVGVATVSQVIGGTLDAATFDANLAVEMNAGVLSVNEAVLFTPTAGSYSGQRFLIVDGNGLAGYQAGGDFVFLMETPAQVGFFDAGDFF
jgi:Ca2+-binding RTX toxin-like protein